MLDSQWTIKEMENFKTPAAETNLKLDVSYVLSLAVKLSFKTNNLGSVVDR